MPAIGFDDLPFDPRPEASVSTWSFDDHVPARRLVRARRTIRRRRTDLSWIPVMLFAVSALTTVCVFAKSLADPSDLIRFPKKVVMREKSPVVPGRSKDARDVSVVVTPADSRRQSVPSGPAKPVKRSGIPYTPPVTHDPEPNSYVAAAVRACREGRFGDAKALGTTACGSHGQAVCLLADYVGQYETLSREAILRMNGAVDVDLGPEHGLAAFVERVDDTIVFMCRGRHVRRTVDDLLDLTAVRFRITRQFLSNGGEPANDLILAAAHYVHGIDHEGLSDTDGGRAQAAAKRCLTVASMATDPDVVLHAKVLGSLICR